MILDPVSADTLATLRSVTKDLLLVEYSQIHDYLRGAGDAVLTRSGLLFTLLAGFLAFALKRTKRHTANTLLVLAVLFAGVIYVLDWHQRDMSSRVMERSDSIRAHLQNLPSYSREVLSGKALFVETPKHNLVQ